MNTALDPFLAKAERIGVIGSPSRPAELALESLAGQLVASSSGTRTFSFSSG